MSDSSSEPPSNIGSDKPGSKDLGFVAFISLAALVLAGYYWPVLSGNADYYMSDVSYFFQPFCHFMRECLNQGRTPFWNPYMYCGMSQIAIPSPGVFYPPTWLLMYLPYSCGLAAYLGFHQIVAGAGGYFCAKRLGKDNCAAVVAGAMCAFSGYMFALSSNFTLMATAAWLPLCLNLMLSISGEYSHANLQRVFSTALCIALLIGPGRPEVAVPCLVLMGICCLWPLVDSVWVNSPRDLNKTEATESNATKLEVRRRFSQVVLRAIPLLFAVALSAPVTYPAMEWATVSPRAQGLELKWVFTWSANWYDFIAMVLNHPVGDLMLLPNEYRNLVTSRLNYLPFLGSDYVGAAAVTLAVFGLCDSRWRQRWLLLGLFFCFCIMAAGNYTPIAPALLKLSPALATLRYPVKLLIFPVFLMALSSAFGVQLLLERKLSRTALVVASSVWCLIFTAGCVMIASPGLSDIALPSDYKKLMRESQVLFGWSMLQAAALALSLCASAFAFYKDKITRQTMALFVSVLVVLPMVSAALIFDRHWAQVRITENGTKQGLLECRSSLAEELRPLLKDGKRFLTLYFDPLVVPNWYKPAPEWEGDEKFYLYARDMLLPDSHVAESVPHANGYEGAETLAYKELFTDAYLGCSQNRKTKHAVTDAPMARLCQYAATEIVVTQAFDRPAKAGQLAPDIPAMDKKYFEKISEDRVRNLRIYRTKKVNPRISFARSIVAFESLQQCRNALLNSKPLHNQLQAIFTQDDIDRLPGPLRQRLTRGDTGASAEPTPAQRGATDSTGVIDNVKDQIDRLELEVECSADELLILADQFYPGWKARIDGIETPIVRANVFSRAVVVPSGRHRIVFSYEPDSLKFALASVAGVLTLAFALLGGLQIVKRR